MAILRTALMAVVALILVGCAEPSKYRSYDGPEVTQINLYKDARVMDLMHGDQILRRFDVDLGRNPAGHKTREGDGRTPEGVYYIDRRNGESSFHLSLGISYPNAEDRRQAEEAGVSPGGDIFIHGRGPRFLNPRRDWTEGCIAVTDREMEDIYAMVQVGTPIVIMP